MVWEGAWGAITERLRWCRGDAGAVRICLIGFVAGRVPRQLCRSSCNPSAETGGTQCAAIPSSPTCSVIGQGLAWQRPQRSYLQK